MIAPRILVPPMSPSVGPLAATPAAFSEQSLSKLSGVNPLLAEILKETERRALERGIKIEVSEGLRDPARQAELVSAGKSQTLNSRHLTGNAIDVHIRNPDGSPNWDFEAYRPVADIAKQVAADMGVPDLTWGGDWKTLKDGVHFQLGGTNAGGVTMSTSGGQGMGLMDFQEEPKGFMGRLTSPDTRDAILLWLNSMRLNPDQGLGQYVQARQEQRSQESSANRTAQWLMSRGREDLARALMSGAIDPKTAASVALAPADKPKVMEVGDKLVDETGRVIYDGGPDQKEAFGNEVELMKTYRAEPNVQSYYGTANYYGRMLSAYDEVQANPNQPGAGDLAIVYSYMKMLDPGSTVMQGEYASASNTTGAADQIVGTYNRILNGDKLTPDQRIAFLRQAGAMLQDTGQRLLDTNKAYGDTATRYGVDTGFMVTPITPRTLAVTPSSFVPAP